MTTTKHPSMTFGKATVEVLTNPDRAHLWGGIFVEASGICGLVWTRREVTTFGPSSSGRGMIYDIANGPGGFVPHSNWRNFQRIA